MAIKVSPFIHLFEEKGKYLARHLLSGILNEISKDIFDLLVSLVSPPYKEEDIVNVLKDKYAESDISKLINQLFKKGIFIDFEGQDYYVIQKKQTLFGFNLFDPQVNKRCLVFMGIPVGSGNAIDPGCKEFSASFRNYTNSQHIKFKPDNVELLDFSTIDHRIDFENFKAAVNDNRMLDWGDLYISKREVYSEIYNKIFQSSSKIHNSDNIPFLVGGDHSISHASIKAAAKKYKKIQVIQFDAHHDTYDGIMDMGTEDLEIHHGNFVKDLLLTEEITQITQVGVRGLVNFKKPKNKKQKIIYASQCKLEKTNVLPDQKTPVYITFDIDFLDPSVAPATATPVPGGFDFYEASKIIYSLLDSCQIIGVDLVEVNPKKDVDKITTQVALQIILLFANLINYE